MSYYTTIYPKGEFEETTIESLNKRIERSEEWLQDDWENIIAMCAASPRKDTKEAVEEFRNDLITYITFYEVYCRECFNHQYLTNGTLSEDSKECLEWNHFEHSSDPEQGIKDEEKAINYVRDRLVMLCAASPEKIYNNRDLDKSPLDWLSEELHNLRECLNESIYTKVFCELCVKYWDTHEEG